MPPRGAKRPAKAPAAAPAQPRAALFDKYAEADNPDLIGPEGVERLCADLGLDPSDRKVLVLAWTMNAARMGYFTRSEFEAGQHKLGASDLATLKAALPRAAAPTGDATSSAFRAFWDFAFAFCLTQPLQKVVDVGTATAMAGIALPPGCPHASPLAAYLADASGGGTAGTPSTSAAHHPASTSAGSLQVITKDAWQGLGRFVGAHPTPADAGNGYDVDGAWPLLVDGYVEWLAAHPEAVAAAAAGKGGGGGKGGEVVFVGSQSD